jgi:hypothetical protein
MAVDERLCWLLVGGEVGAPAALVEGLFSTELGATKIPRYEEEYSWAVSAGRYASILDELTVSLSLRRSKGRGGSRGLLERASDPGRRLRDRGGICADLRDLLQANVDAAEPPRFVDELLVN